MRRIWVVSAIGIVLSACSPAPTPPEDGDWVSLFNGENLEGWIPKISGYPLGENALDTFRVEDGVLKVSYENYDEFDGRFGHLFYEKPFSHYWLRVEYRFVGDQVPGAPDWGFRNNGLMLHAQPPEMMPIDQNFPYSIEMRLLGAEGDRGNTTGGLCKGEGVSVDINGKRAEKICINPSRGTYPGDQWVRAEVEVQGDEVVRHFINGKLVMEYTNIRLDEPQPWSPDAKMASGYIALQAESHPTEFRRIEILNLEE